MRKTIGLFVLLAGLLVLTSCNVNVTVNGLPPEEYYISTEYPDYEIVKTAAVADIQAYLLKGEEDYNLVFFIDGEYIGGTNNITGMSGHISGDSDNRLVIIAGENPGGEHTAYSLTFLDNPSIGNDYMAMMTASKDNWHKTYITRDVSRQEYILDIYLLPTYYSLDFNSQSMHWEDGTVF